MGWQLGVKTAGGAKISITDNNGDRVFSGQVPAKGAMSIPLIQYVQKRNGRVVQTPHTVTIEKDGKTETTLVTMDKARRIEMGICQ